MVLLFIIQYLPFSFCVPLKRQENLEKGVNKLFPLSHKSSSLHPPLILLIEATCTLLRRAVYTYIHIEK